MKLKAQLPVDERVMYDDVNEFFWARANIDRLMRMEDGKQLAVGDKAHLAYETVRSKLRRAKESAQGPAYELLYYFHKTFRETVSLYRVLYVFARVLVLHAVAWHGCLTIAFFKSTKWRYTCQPVLTHALLKICLHLYELVPTNHNLTDASRVVKKGFHSRLAVILGYALGPGLFLFDLLFRGDPLLLLFQLYAAVYVALMLGQLVVQHSLLSEAGRRLHARMTGRKHSTPYIGSALQLTVPFTSWLFYVVFWFHVAALKLAFGYYGLAEPLVVPLTALWNLEFDGDGTGRSKSITGNVMRAFVLLLRIATPTCVFFFDTNTFYTIVSAVSSTLLLARYRRIGWIVDWKSMLTKFMDTVELHDAKLVGHADARERAEEARDIIAVAGGGGLSGFLGTDGLFKRSGGSFGPMGTGPRPTEWCEEARSLSWQRMARTWNAVVHVLRDGDHLTDNERNELLFFALEGEQCESFFGVPEYVIFPTMLSSPVFDSKSWEQNLAHFPAALPALQQTCDLVVWLLECIGLTHESDRLEVRSVIVELARLTGRAIRHAPAGAIPRLIALRATLAALCTDLLELASRLNAIREAEEASASSAASSSSTSVASSSTSAASRSTFGRHSSRASALAAVSSADALAAMNAAADAEAAAAAAKRKTGGDGSRKSKAVGFAPRALQQGKLRLSTVHAHAAVASHDAGAAPRRTANFGAGVRGIGRTKGLRMDARASTAHVAAHQRAAASPMGRQSVARARQSMAQLMASDDTLKNLRQSICGGGMPASFGGSSHGEPSSPAAGEESSGSVRTELEEELADCGDLFLESLPMLMQVLQDVGDIFGAEEMTSYANEREGASTSHDVVEEEVEAYAQLRKLVRLDTFGTPSAFAHAMQRLAQEGSLTVLAVLVRTLATPNPGSEPNNDEAKRQLIYLCNSLHNRRLLPPPPLTRAKSFTAFTPYYNEDVTYAPGDLKTKAETKATHDSTLGVKNRDAMDEVASGDEDNLLTLLKALFADEWENFLERVEVDTASSALGAYPARRAAKVGVRPRPAALAHDPRRDALRRRAARAGAARGRARGGDRGGRAPSSSTSSRARSTAAAASQASAEDAGRRSASTSCAGSSRATSRSPTSTADRRGQRPLLLGAAGRRPGDGRGAACCTRCSCRATRSSARASPRTRTTPSSSRAASTCRRST